MSRALDGELAASLKSGDPTAAYRSISELFVPTPDGDLLELEILGRSHPFPEGCYVLRDGCAAAVSKLGLVQAFFVGRKILTGHIDGTSPRKDDELLAATAVMLLMDPEHLTAANTRKRVLQRRISSGHSPVSRSSLKAEKHFLDSLLTSRLHRHTKSPTLWAHLQWLLREFSSAGIPILGISDLKNVIFVAGERHPRNYYAWNHARFLLRTASLAPDEAGLTAVMKWCAQHHTDTSGWSFLYFFLTNMASSGPESAHKALEGVLALVQSLRLTNESVWVFLRTLAASPLTGEEDHSRFLTFSRSFIETSKLSTDHGMLRSALGWCETHRTKPTPTELGVTRSNPDGFAHLQALQGKQKTGR
jgi:protein prenyltransferase alpha subunit repeat containing protein 1